MWTRSAFTNHKVIIHAGIKNFQCDQCSKSFCQMSDMKNHKKVVPYFSHDKSVVSIKDSYFITEGTDQDVLGAHNCNSRIRSVG